MYTKRRMEIHPVPDKEKLRWIENPNFFPSFLPSFPSLPFKLLSRKSPGKKKATQSREHHLPLSDSLRTISTNRSSENICSSNGGAQEEGRIFRLHFHKDRIK
jgi:hypothetical protein